MTLPRMSGASRPLTFGETGSLGGLLLLDAVKDGTNVIQQFDRFALAGVVVPSSVIHKFVRALIPWHIRSNLAGQGCKNFSLALARDCGCCSGCCCSCSNNCCFCCSCVGSAAGRADELEESVMLNNRSKESITRCMIECVGCCGCTRKRARGVPKYIYGSLTSCSL